MERFRLLEHTADIGIEAHAGQREGLAEQSGLGLKFLLFGDVDAAPAVSSGPITAGGNTAEETLVNWLNELLFVITSRELLPAQIRVGTFSDTEISGEFSGESLDPQKHRFLREIKAVTHHQTRVEHDHDHWQSTVYLDL